MCVCVSVCVWGEGGWCGWMGVYVYYRNLQLVALSSVTKSVMWTYSTMLLSSLVPRSSIT